MSGTALVEIRDLVKHFPLTRGIVFQRQVGAVQAVDGVTFDVMRGRDARHRGRVGLRQVDDGAAADAPARADQRRDRYRGQDIAHLSRRELKPLRRDMQMIFQDPYSSLNPRKTVGTIIGEPFVIHGSRRQGERKRRSRS